MWGLNFCGVPWVGRGTRTMRPKYEDLQNIVEALIVRKDEWQGTVHPKGLEEMEKGLEEMKSIAKEHGEKEISTEHAGLLKGCLQKVGLDELGNVVKNTEWGSGTEPWSNLLSKKEQGLGQALVEGPYVFKEPKMGKGARKRSKKEEKGASVDALPQEGHPMLGGASSALGGAMPAPSASGAGQKEDRGGGRQRRGLGKEPAAQERGANRHEHRPVGGILPPSEAHSSMHRESDSDRRVGTPPGRSVRRSDREYVGRGKSARAGVPKLNVSQGLAGLWGGKGTGTGAWRNAQTNRDFRNIGVSLGWDGEGFGEEFNVDHKLAKIKALVLANEMLNLMRLRDELRAQEVKWEPLSAETIGYLELIDPTGLAAYIDKREDWGGGEDGVLSALKTSEEELDDTIDRWHKLLHALDTEETRESGFEALANMPANLSVGPTAGKIEGHGFVPSQRLEGGDFVDTPRSSELRKADTELTALYGKRPGTQAGAPRVAGLRGQGRIAPGGQHGRYIHEKPEAQTLGNRLPLINKVLRAVAAAHEKHQFMVSQGAVRDGMDAAPAEYFNRAYSAAVQAQERMGAAHAGTAEAVESAVDRLHASAAEVARDPQHPSHGDATVERRRRVLTHVAGGAVGGAACAAALGSSGLVVAGAAAGAVLGAVVGMWGKVHPEGKY